MSGGRGVSPRPDSSRLLRFQKIPPCHYRSEVPYSDGSDIVALSCFLVEECTKFRGDSGTVLVPANIGRRKFGFHGVYILPIKFCKMKFY